MNDAPVDIGIVNNSADALTPIIGEPLPIVGIVAFLDHSWIDRVQQLGRLLDDRTSTTPTARRRTPTRRGHYALGNLLHYPVPNVMFGGELQWGRRENFSDGFHSDGLKLQFSFKYNFSQRFGG